MSNAPGNGKNADFFDPQFLQRLRTLFFRLRKRRQLQKKGTQSTPTVGFTREFKDHRNYSPGDEYRSIDWRLYARLGRMFIRVFEQVQEFHVHILVDRSRSMIEPYPEKRVMALKLAVALAYLALVSEHRVSLLTMGGSADANGGAGSADQLRREAPPLKGPGHIYHVIDMLGGLEFGGVTHLTEMARQFRLSRDRRGIVFIISDLFGHGAEDDTQLIHKAAGWPAETHVIQVLHPREADPELEGELRLVEVETGEIRRVWLTRRDREAYRKAFADHGEALRQMCMGRQVNYVPWPTDQDFEDLFVSLLSRGSALAGQ